MAGTAEQEQEDGKRQQLFTPTEKHSEGSHVPSLAAYRELYAASLNDSFWEEYAAKHFEWQKKWSQPVCRRAHMSDVDARSTRPCIGAAPAGPRARPRAAATGCRRL